MWLVKTFDDYEQYLQMFNGAEIVGTYQGMTFKKKVGPLSRCYGMFDREELVAYYWLISFTSRYPNVQHGFELRVHEDYQRRRIALTFYLEILLEDRQWVVSDYSHSPESATIWEKMLGMSALEVGMYNRITDSIDWKFDKSKIYGNDFMHYIVRAR